MKLIVKMGLFIILAITISLLAPAAAAYAQLDLVDGTYTAEYVVLKAEDDSASMANDYWEKPATVIISNGKTTVQMTVNHSKWVTEFKVPGAGGYVKTNVLSNDKAADKRLVEFDADDLSKPLLSKIHVTVEDIDYDHDYTIRFVFKLDSFTLVKAAIPKPDKAVVEKPVNEPVQPVASPEPSPSKATNASNKPASASASPDTVKEPAPSKAADSEIKSNPEKSGSGSTKADQEKTDEEKTATPAAQQAVQQSAETPSATPESGNNGNLAAESEEPVAPIASESEAPVQTEEQEESSLSEAASLQPADESSAGKNGLIASLIAVIAGGTAAGFLIMCKRKAGSQ